MGESRLIVPRATQDRGINNPLSYNEQFPDWTSDSVLDFMRNGPQTYDFGQHQRGSAERGVINIDPFEAPTRVVPPVTLPNQPPVRTSGGRRRQLDPAEQPLPDPGPDIIPPFMSTVEAPSIAPPMVYMDGRQVDSRDTESFIHFLEQRRLEDQHTQIEIQRNYAQQIALEREEAARGIANRYTYNPNETFRDSWYLNNSYRLIMQHLEYPALYPLPPVLQNELEINRLQYIYHPRYIVQQSARWMLGDDNALEPFRPELETLEENLDRAGLFGSFAGIGLGLLWSLREITSGLPDLINMLSTIRPANSDDYADFLNIMRELANSEITNQAVSRQIADIIQTGFQGLQQNIDRIYEQSSEGHLVRPAAEITQITVGIIEIIDGIHGVLALARHSPEMLTRLQSASRSFRRQIQQMDVPDSGYSEFRRFLADEQGSAVFGSSRGKTRQAPITVRPASADPIQSEIIRTPRWRRISHLVEDEAELNRLRDVFYEMDRFRLNVQLPEARTQRGVPTLARLELSSVSDPIYGVSTSFSSPSGASREQVRLLQELLREIYDVAPHRAVMEHAEADAIITAWNGNIMSQTGILYTDRPLCGFCATSLRRLFPIIGLQELSVYQLVPESGQVFRALLTF